MNERFVFEVSARINLQTFIEQIHGFKRIRVPKKKKKTSYLITYFQKNAAGQRLRTKGHDKNRPQKTLSRIENNETCKTDHSKIPFPRSKPCPCKWNRSSHKYISNTTACETMIKSMKRDNSREGRKICRWQGDETKKGWLIDGSPVLIIVLRYNIYIYILDSENIENGNGPKLTSHLTFRMKTGSVHVSKGRFSTRRQMFSRGCRGIEAGDDRTVLCRDGDFNLLVGEIVKNCFESCCITLRMGTKGTMFDCYAGIESGKIGEEVFEGSYGLY